MGYARSDLDGEKLRKALRENLRKFRTEACLEFSGKLLKHISRDIPQANLTTRNFPLSVAELRRRSRIREGGDTYLFATTLANGQKAIILCHKA